MAASKEIVPTETVAMLRHESRGAVRNRVEALKPPPMPSERLRCQCGNTHFFVTKVDFVCTSCDRSYRD